MERARALVLIEQADPELYDSELDWYYCVCDSECGFTSALASQVEMLNGCSSTSRSESNIYTDKQTHPSEHTVVFARQRRVWRALQKIDMRFRRVLQAWYEERQHKPEGYDAALKIMQQTEVRSAHTAYRLARRTE